MVKMLIICLIMAIIIGYIFYVYRQFNEFSYNDTYNFPLKNNIVKTIPKVIIQTYYDKSKIPNKVYENIRKYAPGYKHIIYDDDDCIALLSSFDIMFKHNKKGDTDIVDKFKSLKKGAHKADFFRYCYLYMYGGVYLDIKTELIQPLDNIITETDNILYTVIARNREHIYQGVICSYPRHPIIGNLVNQCIGTNNILLLVNYSLFLKFFYITLQDNIKSSGVHLIAGKFQLYDFGYLQLFQENDRPISDCVKKDRYGSCTFIHDTHGNKIIKTRYSDFPWK